MPISRTRKEELVAQYVELLEKSNGFALVQSTGMSVPQVQALRKKIYDAGGQYMVAKNTLLRVALEQAGWYVPDDVLDGRIAVAFGVDNFPGVAKAVLEYIKDATMDEKMQIRGGVMAGDTTTLSPNDVKSISELPTLPELQAQIIGLLVQPSRNIVTILQQAESGVVNVLQAWLDKDKDGTDEGAA